MGDQKKLEKLIIRLENYNAKNKKKIHEKNKVLKSGVELFHARENIVDFFKKGVFPFKGNVFKQNHSGKGLKILTPNEMLSRLPITLSHLKAGNNSEKLKKEIRQLLYSLYSSKNLTKQLYKSFIDII